MIETKLDTSTKSNRTFYSLLFIGVSVLFLGVLAFLLFFWRIPEIQIEQTFQIYPSAEKRFEIRAYDHSKLGQKNLYYWSVDNLTEVRKFYEKYYLPFKPGDPTERWLITVISKADSLSDEDTLGLANFCFSQDTYKCATVSLVDLDKQNPQTVSIALPYVGMQTKDELTEKIASLPSNGTLIVYSYFIAKF